MTEARFEASSASANEPAMLDLLSPKGRCTAIGTERGTLRPQGISRLVSPHGSTRYLYSRDGEPVAVLQIVSHDGGTGLIANVYTLPGYRRQGLAQALLNAARADFETIIHNSDLTADGAAWANAVEGNAD